jgi:hypothetical protein
MNPTKNAYIVIEFRRAKTCHKKWFKRQLSPANAEQNRLKKENETNSLIRELERQNRILSKENAVFREYFEGMAEIRNNRPFPYKYI